MHRNRIAAAVLGAVLFGTTILGTVAQQATPATSQEPQTGQQGQAASSPEAGTTTLLEPIVQTGGAEGLIAAVVQVADVIDITDSNIEVVTIEVEDSLNNLRALNNVLNNSPILSENNIVITDVIEIGSIDALIAIGVLDGGDLILFTTGQ